MTNHDIDGMLTDEFLSGLEDNSHKENNSALDRPSWVSEDEQSSTAKAWRTMLELKEEKEKSIENFKKIATKHTPKSIHCFTQSAVAKKVGVSPQSLFHASSFSTEALKFFNDVNLELEKLWEDAKKKQEKRKSTGIRGKKKDEIRESHQQIEAKLKRLRERTTKEILDLTIERMPLDLKHKLNM